MVNIQYVLLLTYAIVFLTSKYAHARLVLHDTDEIFQSELRKME